MIYIERKEGREREREIERKRERERLRLREREWEKRKDVRKLIDVEKFVISLIGRVNIPFFSVTIQNILLTHFSSHCIMITKFFKEYKSIKNDLK